MNDQATTEKAEEFTEVPPNTQVDDDDDYEDASSQEAPSEASSAALEDSVKFEQLGEKLQSDLVACCAKWSLFVAAVLSDQFEAVANHFPPKFLAKEADFDMDAVYAVVRNTPQLNDVLHNLLKKQYKGAEDDVVALLHWLLVEQDEPRLRTVDVRDFHDFILRCMGEKAVLPSNVFQVHSSRPSIFQLNPREVRKQWAFYGNNLERFYSVLQKGFASGESEVLEEGAIDLYTDLAKVMQRSRCEAGFASPITCVALCEYFRLPEHFVSAKDSKIRVTKPDFVRLRYLIFFDAPAALETPRSTGLLNWLTRNRVKLSLATYVLVTLSVSAYQFVYRD